MRVRLVLMWGGFALLVAVFVGLVAQKEQVLKTGQPVLLRLAPVDPRSLIEGDYMRLRYAIEAEASWPSDGLVVVRLDANGVGERIGLYRGQPLGPGDLTLRYRRRRSRTQLGAEAFYFEEGTAAAYAKAAYGELRVAPSGDSVLVGLRDANRVPLTTDAGSDR